MPPPEFEKPRPLEPSRAVPEESVPEESGSKEAGSKEAGSEVIRTWASEQLLGEANEARIVHRGETYRLLRTRSQKLILVK